MKKKLIGINKCNYLQEGTNIEAYAYFIHKTVEYKKHYFFKKSKNLFNKNNLICPITLPKLDLQDAFEFNLNELENTCGFNELKNFYLTQPHNFLSIGKYTEEDDVKILFHSYSIDVTMIEQRQVEQLREPYFDYVWISEEELDDHICSDDIIVYSGLVFCYTKFLLKESST